MIILHLAHQHSIVLPCRYDINKFHPCPYTQDLSFVEMTRLTETIAGLKPILFGYEFEKISENQRLNLRTFARNN